MKDGSGFAFETQEPLQETWMLNDETWILNAECQNLNG